MFLRECEMYSEAVTTILSAMMELRDYRKSESKDKTIKHPELKHGRYKKLYRDLQEYYETYKQKRLRSVRETNLLIYIYIFKVCVWLFVCVVNISVVEVIYLISYLSTASYS